VCENGLWSAGAAVVQYRRGRLDGVTSDDVVESGRDRLERWCVAIDDWLSTATSAAAADDDEELQDARDNTVIPATSKSTFELWWKIRHWTSNYHGFRPSTSQHWL